MLVIGNSKTFTDIKFLNMDKLKLRRIIKNFFKKLVGAFKNRKY